MKIFPFVFALFFLHQINGQGIFDKRMYYAVNTLQEARRVIRTPDNNFLVVGYITSASNSLDRDGLVFKMTASGDTIWAKRYGCTNGKKNWEEFSDVVQVGNYYYCVGSTRTFVNATFISGGVNIIADVFVVKLNLDGTVVWAKNMGRPTTSTSSTIGDDLGQRVVASGQGGVIIAIRINATATTGSNGGLIWVDSDGKTKWANQYDVTSNSSVNELTSWVWKDNSDTYITGGWLGPSSTGFNHGLLYKVNQKGDLVWKKSTRITPGFLVSQYYGYYNRKTGKIYTTDFYNQTTASIREIQVCTNMGSTGSVPTAGTIPQARRFHYGAANSSANNFRAAIFPVGDGYEQFILAAYDLTTITLNTTKYVTLIAVDEDLTLQWTKKVGLPHPSSAFGYRNQINDIIACDGNNQSLLAVGTLSRLNGGNTYKDIYVSRITASATTTNSCETSASINSSNLTENDSTLTSLRKVDLNAGCTGVCWAGNNLINKDSIIVSKVSLISNKTDTCLVLFKPIEADGPLDNGPNHIIPNLLGPLTDLAFVFLKQPKEVYFEMTDLAGNFVYQRSFGDINKLIQGFKFASMNFLQGDYTWEIEAVYEGEQGIERKVGAFKIQ